jgi:hypothetical protein
MTLHAVRKSVFTRVLGFLALFGMASVAFAANVHFKRDPRFTDQGLSLTSTISLTGLGNGDVTITVDVTGDATYTLYNPAGGFVPGQNKIPIASSTSVTVPSNQIKNGNLTVTLSSPVPVAPPAKDLGAPNNNWTAEINDVSFTTVTITVVQGGQIVLQESFDL